MQGIERKTAVAAYKERKVAAGIYVIRCEAGPCWVGRAPDLSTIRNRIWFTLRLGSHSHRDLQAAWRTHGEAAFAFEILETIAEEEIAYVREKRLKARLAHWSAELGAATI